MTEELSPWIEARFPADAADRTLTGHSYAGHFALYAWATRPGFYRRILAGSPYWNEKLERWLTRDAPVPTAIGVPTRLDVASGFAGLDYANCVVTLARRESIEAARARLGLGDEIRFALYPDFKHAAVAHPIYAYGLPWLFSARPGLTEVYGTRAEWPRAVLPVP